MDITPELILEFRELINDNIEPYVFADEKLIVMLTNAKHIYCAAAQGWLLKSLKYSEMDSAEGYSIGDESYNNPVRDPYKLANENYERFKALCEQETKKKVSYMFGCDTKIEL